MLINQVRMHRSLTQVPRFALTSAAYWLENHFNLLEDRPWAERMVCRIRNFLQSPEVCYLNCRVEICDDIINGLADLLREESDSFDWYTNEDMQAMEALLDTNSTDNRKEFLLEIANEQMELELQLKLANKLVFQLEQQLKGMMF